MRMIRNIFPMGKVSVQLRNALASVVAGGLVVYWNRKSKFAVQSIRPSGEKQPIPIKRDYVSETAHPCIKIGSVLGPLVDVQQGAPLINSIARIRYQLSRQLGFAVAHVPIEVDFSLEPSSYRIMMSDVVLGEGSVSLDDVLALDDGSVDSVIQGTACKDPTFGMHALWIPLDQVALAIAQGYIVVDTPTVIATHFSDVVQHNAADLFGEDDAQKLIDSLKRSSPQLAASVGLEPLSLNVVTAICRELLAENVPLKDFQTISRAMSYASSRHSETADMVETIRQQIGDLIVRAIVPVSLPIPVITLDASLENFLDDALRAGDNIGHPFGRRLAHRMIEAVNIAAHCLPLESRRAALVTSPALRRSLSAMLKPRFPGLSVLSYQELPEDKSIEVLTKIGLPLSSQAMAVTNSNPVQ